MTSSMNSAIDVANNKVVQGGMDKQQDGFSRRLRIVMGLAAVLCFSIAFAHHNMGAAHYASYADSYMDCANDPLFGIHAIELCKTTPTVRNHLEAHLLANAMFVPMLSLGLSLAFSALCLPLTLGVHRRLRGVDPGRAPNTAAAIS